jgi:hypothetical protein
LLAKLPPPISTSPDRVKCVVELQALGSGRLLMPTSEAVDTSFGRLTRGQGVDAA